MREIACDLLDREALGDWGASTPSADLLLFKTLSRTASARRQSGTRPPSGAQTIPLSSPYRPAPCPRRSPCRDALSALRTRRRNVALASTEQARGALHRGNVAARNAHEPALIYSRESLDVDMEWPSNYSAAPSGDLCV